MKSYSKYTMKIRGNSKILSKQRLCSLGELRKNYSADFHKIPLKGDTWPGKNLCSSPEHFRECYDSG